MQVQFWGTRGSLAKPGPTTVRYGGNTACVEVRAGSTLIVLDCGTGAHELGLALLAREPAPIHGHLLISHTHWDHIQGFPFFGPLFVPGNEWDLYAPGGMGQRLADTLAGQMEYTYFPVTLDQLAATIHFHDLLAGSYDIGKVRVATRYLNHPALTMGYRLEAEGVTLVYATDHEPYAYQAGSEGPHGRTLTPLVHEEDRRHIEFLAGADLVIHDAQYTIEEYASKRNWGHTPAEQAVDFCLAAGARRLALFHHDPLRSDDALDALVARCRERATAAGEGLEVFAAAEGQAITLAARGAGRADRAVASQPGTLSPAAPAGTEPAAVEEPVLAGGAARPATILIVDDDPDIVELLTIALGHEHVRTLSTLNGEEALRLARTERPDLILLDIRLPARNGLDVCRTLRADPDERLRATPIVMLTSMTAPEEVAAGFNAGATDYLTKPFTLASVRSRVEGWLLRSAPPGP